MRTYILVPGLLTVSQACLLEAAQPGVTVDGQKLTARTSTVQAVFDGPALVSPHGSGSLRYADSVTDGVERFYYFEAACRDGSHELRGVYYPETVEELGDEEET